MRQKTSKETYLFCSHCGKRTSIYRRKEKLREKYHIKHMWCWNCSKKVAHIEIPDGYIDLQTAYTLYRKGSKVEIIDGVVSVKYDLERHIWEKENHKDWNRYRGSIERRMLCGRYNNVSEQEVQRQR